MTRENKARINQALAFYNSIRYKNPKEKVYEKSDNNTNALTNCIIDFTEYNGFLCERVSVQGAIQANHKIDGATGEKMGVHSYTRTKTNMKAGSADIHMVILGKAIKAEVKFGKDRQSNKQKIYQLEAELSGSLYRIFRNFDEYIDFYDQMAALDTIEDKTLRITKIIEFKGLQSLRNYEKTMKRTGSPPNPREIYYTDLVPHPQINHISLL